MLTKIVHRTRDSVEIIAGVQHIDGPLQVKYWGPDSGPLWPLRRWRLWQKHSSSSSSIWSIIYDKKHWQLTTWHCHGHTAYTDDAHKKRIHYSPVKSSLRAITRNANGTYKLTITGGFYGSWRVCGQWFVTETNITKDRGHERIKKGRGKELWYRKMVLRASRSDFVRKTFILVLKNATRQHTADMKSATKLLLN